MRITPFREEFLTPGYVAWLNDRALMRFSEQRHHVHTLESCRTFWNSFSGTPHRFWAIVELLRGVGHIGNISATIDPNNGLADVALLIGATECRGLGYGLEAWRAVCDHLLARGDIRKVTAGTLTGNEAMRCIMERSGMIPDGTRSRHYIAEGVERDLIHMARFR
ncbi:MAG: GNAT family N-acetyltransferase [Magnetococcales bacterium]|nr:GNAT family N-acetyltransferase [Magnetococcales bacterium]